MNVLQMQFLDVSVKVGIAERRGWRAEGEREAELRARYVIP